MPSLVDFFERHSGALSLISFGYMVQSVDGAPCLHCFGNTVGCDNSGNNCPVAKEVTANATVIVAGVGGMLALRYAIPNYFASHFPMTIMSQISALAGRRQSDQVFDCTGKSTKEIV